MLRRGVYLVNGALLEKLQLRLAAIYIHMLYMFDHNQAVKMEMAILGVENFPVSDQLKEFPCGIWRF